MSAPPAAEWALVTVAFVDIRDFTAYAHQVTAQEAAAFLEEFFDVVVPAVTRHGGWVNHLLGDGLLAVWDGEGHADRALAAGAEAVGAVATSLGDRCRVGVGVNSGLVLLGRMGGGGFSEHGVVGDPVNVAARVQDATRDLSVPLLVTEATRVLLDGASPELEPRGALDLRGRPEPVAVHALAPATVTLTGRPARRTEAGCRR